MRRRRADERLLETFLDLVRIDSPVGRRGRLSRRTARERARGARVRRCASTTRPRRPARTPATSSPSCRARRRTRRWCSRRTWTRRARPRARARRRRTARVARRARPCSAPTTRRASRRSSSACAGCVESGGPRPDVRGHLDGAGGDRAARGEGARPGGRRPVTCASCSTPTGRPAASSARRRRTTRSRPTFKGRAAHAGVEPEKGVSAIAMAAEAVSRDARSAGSTTSTTANVGTIEGGTATNVDRRPVRS